MSYTLTAEQREICERVMLPSEVDNYIQHRWDEGGNATVEGKIAVWSAEPPIGYEEARRRKYPELGDQLDVIWKQFNQDRLGGKALIQEVDDMLGGILATKSAHPKS